MLSSWNAVLQLRETRVVLGFNGADEPDPIVDSVDCRSANMGRALGPSKDGPPSTWTGHDPSMEFPASHSTLVWEGQTAEKDGDAFFHLSYEWTAGHWNGLISHQSHSNISEIKRFLAELKKEGEFSLVPPNFSTKKKISDTSTSENVTLHKLQWSKQCERHTGRGLSTKVGQSCFWDCGCCKLLCVSCVRSHRNIYLMDTITYNCKCKWM